MQYLMERARQRNGRRGFTLVELLVVIVVLAVLAAIVLPKFMDSSKRSKESALKADLKLMRNAISLFQTDTGCYPASLNDLKVTTAPAKGIDSAGAQADISASDWHGPYLESVPNYPFASGSWSYGTTSPDVGKLKGATPYDTL